MPIDDTNGRQPDDSGIDFDTSRATRPLLGIILATVVLYYARDILLPVAMAAMLAVVFSPIARRLEPWLGRILSAAIVVLTSILVLAGIVYFVSLELTSVAVEVAGYSGNIARKLSTIEKSTPSWLREVERGFANVQRELNRGNPQPTRPAPRAVQPQPYSASYDQLVKTAGPFLAGLAEAALVFVMLFFLLYSRVDLRDRFVRLSARGGIRVAAQAIDAAGDTVSHYLFLFSLINLSFGITTGLILWALGIPHPELWGSLGFILRYIPYIGATVSSIMPALVAFALFPGWGKTLEVFAAFVVIDQLLAQFFEPFLIGHGIGVSPVALLFSAAYWTWLWGPAGLLLATPLTACIKVAGDYIPALDFFSLLLGADTGQQGYHDYYRKLLELDRQGAQALATHYCDEHGLERTFREIFIRAINLAGHEFEDNHIGPATQQFVIETTRELIAELGNRFSMPIAPARLRVLGLCTPGDAHCLGLLMLLELLRQDGMAASFAGENNSTDQTRDFVNRFVPDVICITSTLNSGTQDALGLIRALKTDWPELTIVAGGKAAIVAENDFRIAGCARVCANDVEGRRAVRQCAAQIRSRSAERRRFPIRLGLRPYMGSPQQNREPRKTGDKH